MQPWYSNLARLNFGNKAGRRHSKQRESLPSSRSPLFSPASDTEFLHVLTLAWPMLPGHSIDVKARTHTIIILSPEFVEELQEIQGHAKKDWN